MGISWVYVLKGDISVVNLAKTLKPGVVLLKVTIIEESPGNSQFFVLYYCYLLLGGSKKISTKGIFFFGLDMSGIF